MNASLADAGVELRADPGRTLLQLFLPGESTPGGRSRTQAVLDRVRALPPDEITRMASEVLSRMEDRHPDLEQRLRRHALSVWPAQTELPRELGIVVGAVFSAESAPEGAALCNPSVVAHPDQSGLGAGELRVVVSLRLIGEGHVSSVGFCEATIGPGRSWRFAPRDRALQLARISDGRWTRRHLTRALHHRVGNGELARAVTQALPANFGGDDVEKAVRQLSAAMLHQSDARSQQELIRIIAGSAYQARFDENSQLSQRTLLPAADEESHGMEDVRLVHFTDDDGAEDYRGTYTAYDGHAIATRLISTKDFRSFTVQRPTGPSTAGKGLVLFPRRIGGVYVALARGDGESIGMVTSSDGLDWSAESRLRYPRPAWEIVQSGTCSSPIETAAGWLVITHGVGPLREYSLGALLLDLEDPRTVRGFLDEPLLRPEPMTYGYVPHVAYSCGAIVHDAVVWVPYGLADQSIRVGSVPLVALLAELLASDDQRG